MNYIHVAFFGQKKLVLEKSNRLLKCFNPVLFLFCLFYSLSISRFVIDSENFWQKDWILIHKDVHRKLGWLLHALTSVGKIWSLVLIRSQIIVRNGLRAYLGRGVQKFPNQRSEVVRGIHLCMSWGKKFFSPIKIRSHD